MGCKSLFSICLILSSWMLNGQTISFNTPSSQDQIPTFNSLDPIAIVDMNNDLMDDIVVLDRGRFLYIAYQQLHNLPFVVDTLPISFKRAQWNMAVADMNADGIRDIVTVGNKDGISIIFRSDSTERLQKIPNSIIYSQSLNLVDIDGDGFLDIFVADDENRNRIYINDQQGNWNYRPNLFSEPNNQSISSGNYGSVWEDFDMDGDMDVYVTKCRGGVNDPKDPRRRNRWFRQAEDGSFEDIAPALNVDFGSQSWTVNFGDLDNDGDMDFIVTNHDVAAQIMENVNGQYIDRKTFSQVNIQGATIQSYLDDFDNDGILDILVGGEPAYLYRGLGNWAYEKQLLPSDIYDIISFGIGDLNNDGFRDMYASFPKLVNEISPLQDELFLGVPNGNNFIDFNLIGASANSDAIGAIVQLFYNDQQQMRSIRSGESYGIMNSYRVHFGLGKSNEVDSVRVLWPSGKTAIFHPDKVNQTYILEENDCITSLVELRDSSFYVICKDDTMTLQAPSGSEYKWSNGASTDRIFIDRSGTYVVSYTDNMGCKAYSSPITVLVGEVQKPRVRFLAGDVTNCPGTVVELVADGDSLGWITGDGFHPGDTLRVTEPTVLQAVNKTACNVFFSDSISVSFLDEIEEPKVAYTQVHRNGYTKVYSNQSKVLWYANSDSEYPSSRLDTLELGPLLRDTTIFVSSLSDYQYTPDTTGEIFVSESSGGYHVKHKNVSTYFEVLKDIHLYEVAVYTKYPGDRNIIILDPDGRTIFDEIYTLDSGLFRLQLDVEIDARPGNFAITTDTDVNEREFGFRSPQLWRINKPYAYPYTYNDRLRIVGSSLGLHSVYYFFDWLVSPGKYECESNRIPVNITLDSITRTEEMSLNLQVNLYPNPTSHWINLDFTSMPERVNTVFIKDVMGRTLHRESIDPASVKVVQLDVSLLPNGLYWIWLENEGGKKRAIQRFVKVE